MPSTIPKGQANFETSLASRISSSASSFTLNTSTDADGTTMTGTYAFTFDEGTSVEEHIIATMVGSAGTIVTRGVSRTDGATNVAAFQFAHDRGATVKSTNHPALIRIIRLLNGTDAFNATALTGIASVSGLTTPTAGETTKAANVQYVNDVSVAGASDATTTSKGIVEIATQAELYSGATTGGTGASVVSRPAEIAYATQQNRWTLGQDTVGTDSYAVTLTPAPAALLIGQEVVLVPFVANTGGATLNVNALGAKTILKNHDQALETGDFEAGGVYTLVYDGTNFQVQTPSSGTMATALQGQLNTGYSANVTGTNLATLTAGTASDADALHTHGELDTLIDYTSNTQLTSNYTTYTIPTYAGTGFWTSNIGTVTTNSPFLWSAASTGIQTKSFVGLTSASLAGDTILQWNNNRKIRIKTMMRMTHNSGIISFGLVCTTSELYAAQTDTNNAYIRFVNNAGTWYVANTSTNAGGNTNTAISTPSDSMQLFEIVLTPGVDIKFYIAETLVATHTTNLPTQAADITVGWGCSTSGQGLYHTPVVVSVSNA